MKKLKFNLGVSVVGFILLYGASKFIFQDNLLSETWTALDRFFWLFMMITLDAIIVTGAQITNWDFYYHLDDNKD